MRRLALLMIVPAAIPLHASRAVQVYTNVTAQMGINVPGLGSGTAWSDFDLDGDLDLLVSDSDLPYPRCYLYRNDGTIFTNVFSTSGLRSEARNFAVGDYDNDGRDDIVEISFGYEQTRLFRNLGAMRFQDVSATAGIYGTYSWRCAWVDYDSDGFLDLWAPGGRCGSRRSSPSRPILGAVDSTWGRAGNPGRKIGSRGQTEITRADRKEGDGMTGQGSHN